MKRLTSVLGLIAIASFGVIIPVAAQSKKPNIVVILSDDVGIWNISAYHRGMMGGSTPNIDRVGHVSPLAWGQTLDAGTRAGHNRTIYPVVQGLPAEPEKRKYEPRSGDGYARVRRHRCW